MVDSYSNKPSITKPQGATPHLVVRLDGSEFHHHLKTQQVVCADGLKLQQFAQSHQLGTLQMFQRQLVFEQLGKPNNVLRGGLLAGSPNLQT